MGTQDTLRDKSEMLYQTFMQHPLVYQSKEFGSRIQPNAVMPGMDATLLGIAECFHVLEVRMVGNKYVAGCVDRTRFSANGDNYGERFRWFECYRKELLSLDECQAFCDQFLSQYGEAAEDHRLDGIEHLQSEIRPILQ